MCLNHLNYISGDLGAHISRYRWYSTWFVFQEFLGAMAHGIEGAIGTTYNILGAVNTRVLAALESGDLVTARMEQQRAAQTMHVVFSYGVFYSIHSFDIYFIMLLLFS